MSIDAILSKLASAKSTDSFTRRLDSLKNNQGKATSHIRAGVEQTASRLENGIRSFVVYGEPQSGKTEFMIALCCKLLDEGYQTIFLAMNDNTELEKQNLDRFHLAPELSTPPLTSDEVRKMDVKALKKDIPRIIFCRKNGRILDDLIEKTRFMTRRVLIDDEADYASPDTNVNKDDEPTRINELVGNLSRVNKTDGAYIGVTATPGRLGLNNTFLNDAKEWVFLDPYPEYKGRKFFFPATPEQKEQSNYILKKLPDTGDDPKHLEDAVLRFLLRVAKLNSADGGGDRPELTAYSMLIHTAGKINDHEADKKVVDRVLERLKDLETDAGRRMAARLLEQAQSIQISQSEAETQNIVLFVLQNVGRSAVLVINNKQDRANVLRASQPKTLFTFAIGGNIVSRGLTFERLLTFFFSRSVKGKFQQNTFIQRARMFGHRPYSEFFELCIPKDLFAHWADCFQAHEISLLAAKSGNPIFVQKGKNVAADSGAIDKQAFEKGRSEQPVGSIVDATEELCARLIDRTERPHIAIRQAISDGVLPAEGFAASILDLIEETSSSPDTDVLMVLKKADDGLKIQEIESYGDADVENIRRQRGGVIDAITHKRREYAAGKHFILPVTNRAGKLRFFYKNELGNQIWKNKIVDS